MPNGRSLAVSHIWGHPEVVDAADNSEKSEINVGGLAAFRICTLTLDSKAVSTAITNTANLVQSGSIAEVAHLSQCLHLMWGA